MNIKQRIVTAGLALMSVIPSLGQNKDAAKSSEQNDTVPTKNIQQTPPQKDNYKNTTKFDNYRTETVNDAKNRVEDKTKEWHTIAGGIKYTTSSGHFEYKLPDGYKPSDDVSALLPREFAYISSVIAERLKEGKISDSDKEHLLKEQLIIPELQVLSLLHKLYRDLHSREAKGEKLNEAEKSFMSEHLQHVGMIGLGINIHGLYQTNNGKTYERISYWYNNHMNSLASTYKFLSGQLNTTLKNQNNRKIPELIRAMPKILKSKGEEYLRKKLGTLNSENQAPQQSKEGQKVSSETLKRLKDWDRF